MMTKLYNKKGGNINSSVLSSTILIVSSTASIALFP